MIVHFHLRNRAGLLLDQEGSSHLSVDAAFAAGRHIARELIGSDIGAGSIDLVQSLVLADAEGSVIGEIPFVDVLAFQHPEDARSAEPCLAMLRNAGDLPQLAAFSRSLAPPSAAGGSFFDAELQ